MIGIRRETVPSTENSTVESAPSVFSVIVGTNRLTRWAVRKGTTWVLHAYRSGLAGLMVSTRRAGTLSEAHNWDGDYYSHPQTFL